jgi:hypothetical protein
MPFFVCGYFHPLTARFSGFRPSKGRFSALRVFIVLTLTSPDPCSRLPENLLSLTSAPPGFDQGWGCARSRDSFASFMPQIGYLSLEFDDSPPQYFSLKNYKSDLADRQWCFPSYMKLPSEAPVPIWKTFLSCIRNPILARLTAMFLP